MLAVLLVDADGSNTGLVDLPHELLLLPGLVPGLLDLQFLFVLEGRSPEEVGFLVIRAQGAADTVDLAVEPAVARRMSPETADSTAQLFALVKGLGHLVDNILGLVSGEVWPGFPGLDQLPLEDFVRAKECALFILRLLPEDCEASLAQSGGLEQSSNVGNVGEDLEKLRELDIDDGI